MIDVGGDVLESGVSLRLVVLVVSINQGVAHLEAALRHVCHLLAQLLEALG